MTLRAQQPASKIVIPVFRKSPESAEETFADDTGIAITVLQPGELILTLRDSSGKTVASKSLLSTFHTVGFLGELLPQIPADFSSGSLVIEHVQPEGIPRALAAAAVYVRGNEMWGAEVTPVDRPATYGVGFKAIDNFQQTAQEMAVQYGFTIRFFLGPPDAAYITALDEVAKALARDPRIQSVEPDKVTVIYR